MDPRSPVDEENCDTFGFILRFLEEKEDVTGIKFEPWHFRYVGKEIASYIMANGMTLEEFTEEARRPWPSLKAAAAMWRSSWPTSTPA